MGGLPDCFVCGVRLHLHSNILNRRVGQSAARRRRLTNKQKQRASAVCGCEVARWRRTGVVARSDEGRGPMLLMSGKGPGALSDRSSADALRRGVARRRVWWRTGDRQSPEMRSAPAGGRGADGVMARWKSCHGRRKRGDASRSGCAVACVLVRWRLWQGPLRRQTASLARGCEGGGAVAWWKFREGLLSSA